MGLPGSRGHHRGVGVSREEPGLRAEVPPSPGASGSPSPSLRGPPPSPGKAGQKPETEPRPGSGSRGAQASPSGPPSSSFLLLGSRPCVAMGMAGQAGPPPTWPGARTPGQLRAREGGGPGPFPFRPPHPAADPAFWETLSQFPLTSVNPESEAHRGRPSSASDLRLPAGGTHLHPGCWLSALLRTPHLPEGSGPPLPTSLLPHGIPGCGRGKSRQGCGDADEAGADLCWLGDRGLLDRRIGEGVGAESGSRPGQCPLGWVVPAEVGLGALGAEQHPGLPTPSPPYQEHLGHDNHRCPETPPCVSWGAGLP